MRQTVILTILFSFTITCYAQKITLKEDVNTSNFPEIEFVVNVYDPDIKKQSDFELKEHNTPVPFNLEYIDNDIKDKSKVVLILFEDMTHRSHLQQRSTFRFILDKSLPGFVKKGDKVNIAVFDRNRDGSTPLRYLMNEYTDDTKELIDKINNFQVKNDQFSNQISSDLYNAIYDGITELSNKFPKRNKIIVVLSAGKNLELSNYNSIETLIQRANKEKIAVYSLQYMLWEHETIDVLSRETFGKYFHIRGRYPIPGDHTKETAADSLVSFMNGAVDRLYGHDYKINYKSTYQEDGDLHTVSVSVDGSKTNIQFKAATCGVVCFVKKYPWWTGGITIVILMLVIIVSVISKKKKRAKESAIHKEIESAKEEAKKTKEELIKQKEELEIKEKQKKYEEELKQKQEEENIKEENLLNQMKRAGVMPALVDVNNTKEYKINKPHVIFGRKENNDYVLKDTYVSGHHFKIFFADGFYFVEDLKSSNGTKLNGKIIKQHKLNHNDVIEAGQTKLIFRF